jgi:hypothetical protein
MYLKDHPAYIGQVKSHRFVYQYEKLEKDPANADFVRRALSNAERNTSCIALDYEKIAELGIDLERNKVSKENPLPQGETINLKEVAETAQPF